MSNDPILMMSTLGAFILMFVLIHINKKQKKFFRMPILFMVIALPIFLGVVIVQEPKITMPFFYISLSLWNAGFFGLFYALFLYVKDQKRN